MHFYLIGIDYKKATVDVRDHIHQQTKYIQDFWNKLAVYSSAILVTCNRIEIYGVSQKASESQEMANVFFKVFPCFRKYGYFKQSSQAVLNHALRLATGLESQIKGEQQILLQLKNWHKNDIVSSPIKKLWGNVIVLADKIREESNLDKFQSNIAKLLYAYTDKSFNNSRYQVLVIGTGKIAELLAKYKSSNVEIVFIAHKNYLKACSLAKESKGKAFFFNDLAYLINEVDVVICATKSQHFVLKKAELENILYKNRRKITIYDLSVPRDVEPQIGNISNVYLQNLNELNDIFAEHNNSKKMIASIKKAEDIIAEILVNKKYL